MSIYLSLTMPPYIAILAIFNLGVNPKIFYLYHFSIIQFVLVAFLCNIAKFRLVWLYACLVVCLFGCMLVCLFAHVLVWFVVCLLACLLGFFSFLISLVYARILFFFACRQVPLLASWLVCSRLLVWLFVCSPAYLVSSLF